MSEDKLRVAHYMSRPKQTKCKRGHDLSGDNKISNGYDKRFGRVGHCCRKCKTMRSNYFNLKKILRDTGCADQIPTIDEFAKEYFDAKTT